MTTLGQELKQERELKGISLQEIADATKINLRFLRALEENRLDILPGKFFTRGIIRSYAKHIGLSEKKILDQYYETAEILEAEIQEEPEKKEIVVQQTSFSRKIFKVSIITAFILAVIISMFFILRKNNPEPPPPPPMVQSTVSEKPKPVPSHEILPEKEPEDLTLKIRYSEETWIQVHADGKLVINSLMQTGQQSEIKALSTLTLNLGNAGGISFLINNKPGRPLGISGQVIKDIRITMDNYKSYLYKEQDSPDEKRDK